MRHASLRHKGSEAAFTDLLFNALLGFAFMFAVAFTQIADPSETGQVANTAEILITLRWPDQHPDDVDAVVEDPRGNLVWYRNRETDLMHLDRDDRGRFQDHLLVDGVLTENPINQETVTLRALQPGEYVVNALHYQANYPAPLPVSVKVEKLNPRLTLVFYDTLQLNGAGDERTAVRFSLDGDGSVVGVSRVQKRLLTTGAKTPA